MMDKPDLPELVLAVRNFLEQKAMPELKGHTAFHARVAVNALDIVLRELAQAAALEAAERTGLAAFVDDAPLAEMNRALCMKIRDDVLGLATPGLLEHLETVTRGKLAVDQPSYSGLKA